jgi:hypothetical protein
MPTLIDRLRAGADNIHSIGPARAADLLREAADALAVLSERATTHEARRLELVRATDSETRQEPDVDDLHRRVADRCRQLARIVGGDPKVIAALGLDAPSLAVAEQFDAEARAAAENPGGLGDIDAVELDMLPMPEQLAEHRRRGESTASVDLWPGSGLPPLMSATTKARIEQWMKRRADPEPRGESYTPEQEAEATEQAERFQGLDDSDRE